MSKVALLPSSSCGKVMFSQASVILSTGGHTWQGTCVAGQHALQEACVACGGMRGKGGGCVAREEGAWQESIVFKMIGDQNIINEF